MGRHEAPVPPGRRAFGAALGTVTIGVLAWLLWIVSTQPGPTVTSPPTTATSAPPTTTTSAPPTTTTSAPPTTTTTAPPTTTTSAPPVTSETAPSSSTTTTLAPLEIGPEGLGVVGLGDPTDEVRAAVDERLGPATSDTGWISSTSELGRCPGTVVRAIRWDSLRLFFSDGPTIYGDETDHLFYFNNSSAETEDVVDIPTARGIGLGSSVADLEDAYGDQVLVESSIAFGPTFTIDPPGPGILSGTLTAGTDDGTITSIAGGFGCGT